MDQKLDFGKIFPSGKLVDKNGDCDLNHENYDVIGLYFSAHWCPPCRGFTPVLSKLYETRSDGDEDGKRLQIVFVSSDRDEESFKEYFATMPWIALKFEHRDTKEELAKIYGISGIPTLVLLDKYGNFLTKDGRSGASTCQKAGDFVRWGRQQKKD